MNKKTLLALAMMAAVTFCTGCSGTKQIGRIGDLEIYKVNLRGLDVPNITALATRNVQDNRVEFLETASGAGLGPAIVGAAGGAGAAALNGVSLRPSTTRVNNNSGSTSTGGAAQTGNVSSGSTAGGGNASAQGGAGGSGQGYGSAGATSSSASQSGSYSQSDSWSGVIGSGNSTTCTHGAGCGVCKH